MVTGTPGIIKNLCSVYFFCTCFAAKEKLFCLSGRTYGLGAVTKEWRRFATFQDAGFVANRDSWYLSDLENRPKEVFAGKTVGLASLKGIRVNEFLKQAKSKRFFMPVGSLHELLECRQFVYPDVPSTDVERRFDDVGVATSVFDMNQLEALTTKMKAAAKKVDLDLRRDAVEPDDKSSFDTDDVGDTLFHIVPGGTNDFGGCAVTVGSKYAAELIYCAVFERGLKKLWRLLTVTQNFERRLEHLIGVTCLKSMLTCLSVENRGPRNQSLKGFS